MIMPKMPKMPKCLTHNSIMLCSMFLFEADLLLAQQAPPPQSVPMRIELLTSHNSCITHQNFPVTMRITNPNASPVVLPGFAIDSYIEPEIGVRQNDKLLMTIRSGAKASVGTRIPITIAAGQSIEATRFIWRSSTGALKWPDKPGTFELEFHLQFVNHVHFAGESQPRNIEWDVRRTVMRVESPDTQSGAAWGWLEGKLQNLERSLLSSATSANSYQRQKLQIYRDFLVRFSESVYSDAIRWESMGLFFSQLDSGALPAAEQAELLSSFENCVRSCLDKGGVFSERLLNWDPERGGSQAIEIAARFERWELADRLILAIDTKYPDDIEAIKYRSVLSAAIRNSMSAAELKADTYKASHPNGLYSGSVDGMLRFLRRAHNKANIPSEEPLLRQ